MLQMTFVCPWCWRRAGRSKGVGVLNPNLLDVKLMMKTEEQLSYPPWAASSPPTPPVILFLVPRWSLYIPPGWKSMNPDWRRQHAPVWLRSECLKYGSAQQEVHSPPPHIHPQPVSTTFYIKLYKMYNNQADGAQLKGRCYCSAVQLAFLYMLKRCWWQFSAVEYKLPPANLFHIPLFLICLHFFSQHETIWSPSL